MAGPRWAGTGEAYAAAPVSSAADVDEAMRAAQAAFETWRDTTPAERSLALLRFADAVERRAMVHHPVPAMVSITGSVRAGGEVARATVAAGGRAVGGPGFLFEPTVVSGLAQDDEMVQDEIFGPVITVQRFSCEDEAVRLANGVQYGLGASVWTRDHARAMRMSRRLDFGVVWVNSYIPFTAEMPHGGFKHSGYGKDLSMYGFEDYTRVKHVMSYLG